MNAIITKKESLVAQRKEAAAQIVSKHSRKLFGYTHATIREIRTEAMRRRLETLFNA